MRSVSFQGFLPGFPYFHSLVDAMNAIYAANDQSLSSSVFEALKKDGLSTDRLDGARIFCQAFFSRVAGSDIDLHTIEQWAVLVAGLLEFAQQRPAGRAIVRMINPEQGTAGRSLLQIVTDDMPFLIDTTSMVLSESVQIHAVIHPVITVERDASGKLLQLCDETNSPPSHKPESVMHFEIDRVADEAYAWW
jgi:glutamate dehydrogenase